MQIFTKIYALTDKHGIPFYVGKTTKSLETRVYQHINEAERYQKGKIRPFALSNENKIKKIIELGFKVNYKLFEIVSDKFVAGSNPKNALIAEYVWITKMVLEGHKIYNISGQKTESQATMLKIIRLKRAALEIRQKIKELSTPNKVLETV